MKKFLLLIILTLYACAQNTPSMRPIKIAAATADKIPVSVVFESRNGEFDRIEYADGLPKFVMKSALEQATVDTLSNLFETVGTNSIGSVYDYTAYSSFKINEDDVTLTLSVCLGKKTECYTATSTKNKPAGTSYNSIYSSLFKEMFAEVQNELQQYSDVMPEKATDKRARVEHLRENTSALKPSSTGTGTFISSDGYVLTAHHVIENTFLIAVIDSEGNNYPAKHVISSVENDLALLKVDVKNAPARPLILSSKVELGDKVFTIGFPVPFLQGYKPKYTEGTISSLYGEYDSARAFQISVPIQGGNSGGGLFDMYGNIIGVVTHGWNDSYTLDLNDFVMQNVSYAIKSTYAIGMVEAEGITLMERSTTIMKPSDVEKAVVQILVR